MDVDIHHLQHLDIGLLRAMKNRDIIYRDKTSFSSS